MKNSYPLLLTISILCVIASVFLGVAGKGVALVFGLWLVHQRKVDYFPFIVLITAFLSTAYILYLQMFLLSVLNYNTIKSFKQTKLFNLFIGLMGAFIFYSTNKYLLSANGLGKSLESYSFVLALAPFFYAMILKGSYDAKAMFRRLFYVLIIIIALSTLFKYLSVDFVSTRLVFFIIPFLFVQIFLHISEKKKDILFVSILVFFATAQLGTFTLLFTALLSLLFVYTSRLIGLKKLTPILLFLIPIIAIINYDKADYSRFKYLEMSEVSSLDDFNDRLSLKLFQDRAPIWSAAWHAVYTTPEIEPPLEPKKYNIQTDGNNNVEWDYHSHNLFLEAIIRLGWVIGLLVSLVFLVINLSSFDRLDFHQDRILKSLFITGIISNVVGSQSGIFPLLLDYTFFSLGLLGILVVLNVKSKINNQLI